METSNRSCTSCTETVSKFFRFKPLELWFSEEQIPQVIVFIRSPQNEESVSGRAPRADNGPPVSVSSIRNEADKVYDDNYFGSSTWAVVGKTE